MPASVTKVIYKPDTQSTDEYTVLVNPVEFKKWKDGDTTIPLVEVVDSYKVFFSNQGSQGILGEASKQQRESVCGSSNADEAVLFVLKNGILQASDSIHSSKFNSKNDARGVYAKNGGKH